jgi:hypothetical protein
LMCAIPISYANDKSISGIALVAQSEEQGREMRPQESIVPAPRRSSHLPAITYQDQSNHANNANRIVKSSVVPKKKRLSFDERRVLRRQIHDASTELYGQPRTSNR